jgi:hypothetical protein
VQLSATIAVDNPLGSVLLAIALASGVAFVSNLISFALHLLCASNAWFYGPMCCVLGRSRVASLSHSWHTLWLIINDVQLIENLDADRRLCCFVCRFMRPVL